VNAFLYNLGFFCHFQEPEPEPIHDTEMHESSDEEEEEEEQDEKGN